MRANAISRRMPYQSHKDVRDGINNGEVKFNDMHLSHVAQMVRYGFIPKPNVAVVEATDITTSGHVYLAASGGSSASYLMMADKIIIELNKNYGDGLKGYHDVYVPKPPPARGFIPIHEASDRIGLPYAEIDWNKVVAVVETDLPDSTGSFKPVDPISEAIAGHILEFLQHERRMGRLPEGLPYQSGVGNVANAVLSAMAKDDSIDSVSLYTEVIQDSIFDLLDADKVEIASGASLTLSLEGQERFKQNMVKWRDKFILRQQEISNHPEVIRRLGIISMNTALEFDIFGNVNSTHVLGSKMMNGIGGSGDFTRNCFLPIFMAPSVAKGGDISSLVPMVTHVDHNEHSTAVFVTEQGLADVRGLCPLARARLIIDKCAHPDYKDLLTEYLEYGLKHAPSKHTPQVLDRAFEFHKRFMETGTMKNA
jgi:acetyl-CoA hydrolase/succinyl-CoA:acetate CoA-transferase